jgi:hypothetical protein
VTYTAYIYELYSKRPAISLTYANTTRVKTQKVLDTHTLSLEIIKVLKQH